MQKKVLEEILDNILRNLKKAGFVVENINYPENKRSIDVIGLYNNSRIMIKVTVDATHISDIEVSDLKKASQAYNASSIVVSRKYRKKEMDPEVVYKRKGINVVNEELLEKYVVKNEKPLVYEAQGNYLVRINPEKFREKRIELGLSLGELADKIGVTRKAIYNYEHGKIGVTINTAIKIAEIMGIDVFEPVDLFKPEKIKVKEEFSPRNKIEELLYRACSLRGLKLYKLLRTPIDYVLKGARNPISIINYRKDPEKIRVKVEEATRIARITGSKEIIIRNINDVKEIKKYLEETLF